MIREAPSKKAVSPNSFTALFHIFTTKNNNSNYRKGIEQNGNLDLFYESSTTLRLKPDKYKWERKREREHKNYRAISIMNIDLKILNNIT